MCLCPSVFCLPACLKPVVLHTKPKDGDFFGVYSRQDYARIDDNGFISEPTLTEVTARIALRYAEVHDRRVPYD